ncbi:hypothetical protein MAM1_0096c05064 [Mucor ambiguus]|uniref:DNA polymerase delta subunit 4 n=1 Tax=Mucor ambiguus TaxID=91626 RepID=A0A0C9MU08_9FUNG|nr:hypothetical protein MAM1_0096c05064 [Mucor ambiguus]
MPPKRQSQSTLNLPKNRRNTRQQQQKLISVHDKRIIRIGTHQRLQKTAATSNKLEIHQEHLGETDKLLRAFDLNYAYGPCVGIKRLNRWDRAHNLGLDPPTNVKDILIKDTAGGYTESVFHQFQMI